MVQTTFGFVSTEKQTVVKTGIPLYKFAHLWNIQQSWKE